MEIALLTNLGLRFKSKQAAIAIDPQDKSVYDAVLVLSKPVDSVTKLEDTVLIQGVGEYEVGGMKVTGMRSDTELIYTIIIDGIEILVGKLQALDKMQHKLKEHAIVIVDCDTEGSAAFITSLAQNVVMFYGEKATAIASSFGKENVKTMNKFSSTKDKLSTEVETILLANS